MSLVTVYHNGSGLLLEKQVSDDLGHFSGKDLSEAEFWEALSANCAAGIAACQLALIQKETTQ